MNVLYVTSDTGGCKFYRCELPGLEMHRAGHTVCVTGHMGIAENGEIFAADASRIDTRLQFEVVVMQRWMGSEAVQDVRRARAYGQVVINDVDDSFWDLPTSHPAYRQTDPSRNLDTNRVHYKRAISASTAVTVSTPHLADRLSSLSVPVHVLRNAIDPSRYEVAEVSDSRTPTLGWVGALSYRSPGDVRLLSEVVGPFMQANSGVRFIHVGTRSDDPGPMAEVLGVEPTRIRPRPFCHVSDLPAAMRGIEVALAPLEDTAFNRSKSWIKALEATAGGIPVIASDMPEYQALGAGVLCSTPKDWTRALEQLCDPQEREGVRARGLEAVDRQDIRHRWVEWFTLYASLVPSHAGNGKAYA